MQTSKLAKISGGSGIGLYFARKFASVGAKVAIFDLRITDEVRNELVQLSGADALAFHELDICDDRAVTAAAEESAAGNDQVG